MIAILPIQPDILQMMAQDIGLEAEGSVWGYFAAEGTEMLGYIVVEKAEPVRIIALQCEDFVIADGLLRRALHPYIGLQLGLDRLIAQSFGSNNLYSLLSGFDIGHVLHLLTYY